MGELRAGGDTGGDVAAVEGTAADATWPLLEGPWAVLSGVWVVDIWEMPWEGAFETIFVGSSAARSRNWSWCLSRALPWKFRNSARR